MKRFFVFIVIILFSISMFSCADANASTDGPQVPTEAPTQTLEKKEVTLAVEKTEYPKNIDKIKITLKSEIKGEKLCLIPAFTVSRTDTGAVVPIGSYSYDIVVESPKPDADSFAEVPYTIRISELINVSESGVISRVSSLEPGKYTIEYDPQVYKDGKYVSETLAKAEFTVTDKIDSSVGTDSGLAFPDVSGTFSLGLSQSEYPVATEFIMVTLTAVNPGVSVGPFKNAAWRLTNAENGNVIAEQSYSQGCIMEFSKPKKDDGYAGSKEFFYPSKISGLKPGRYRLEFVDIKTEGVEIAGWSEIVFTD